MNIGFDRRLGVGDIVVAIPALYMIKKLYPESTLTLFTNKIGKQLCANFDFIDTIISDEIKIDIGGGGNLSELFSQYAKDVLILGERTSKNIKIAKLSSSKRIITWRHLHSIFSPRFKHPKHIKRSQRLEILRCLDLVRMIDTRCYDDFISKNNGLNIANLPITLTTNHANQEYIAQFLDSINAKKYKKIITLNCFGISSAKYNLTMQDWILLASYLAKKYPSILFIFTSFAHNNFTFRDFEEENIQTFVNNKDILNLVELLKHCNLAVSISTGNIHIADNLKIPTFGLFGKSDEKLFPCGNYGATFEALYLPKDWVKNYGFYKNTFEKALDSRIERLLVEN